MSLYHKTKTKISYNIEFKIFINAYKYKKNKRTYEKNALKIEIADDLETLVNDKRLGWRASPSKARRRQRRYKNRMINEIYKI